MKKILLISAVVILAGVGCSQKPEKPAQQAPPPAQQQQENQPEALAPVMNVYEHPKFGFTFLLPLGVVGLIDANGNDVHFVDAINGVERGTMIVQPGIPGIPLPDNKVEKIKVGGVPGHLYHDTDQADGGKVDKLIVDFPKGGNTAYMAAPELPGTVQIDLKFVAETWNWAK